MMTEELRADIQQVFHGYQNGHAMLGSSIDLPSDARKTMLIMSDMSGPAMVTGFEEYLTGYPLPEMNVYVLAKTWYASEMPRPGCVWTHSLLVKFHDLSKLDALGPLAELFNRPSSVVPASTLTPKIFYNRQQVPPPTIEFDPSYVAAVLSALYSFGDKSVVIPALNSRPQSQLMLAIWSQQFGKLRESFSFCSGALSVRRLNGVPLALQACPQEAIRVFRRDVPESIVVDAKSERSEEPRTAFASVLAADLVSGSGRDFRRFLERVVESQSFGRSDVQSLAMIYESIRGSSGELAAVRTIEYLSAKYPNYSDHTELKTRLLQPESNTEFRFDFECGLLRTLIGSNGSAFDPKVINVESRANSLWDADPVRAYSVFKEALRSSTAIAQAVIVALLPRLSFDQFPEVLTLTPDLLRAILELRPEALENERLLNFVLNDHKLSSELLTSQRLSPSVQRQILVQLIASENWQPLATSMRNLPPEGIETILGASNSGAMTFPNSLVGEFQRLGTIQTEAALRWLSQNEIKNISLTDLLMPVLQRNTESSRRLGIKPWLHAFSAMRKRPLRPDQSALFFRAALATGGSDSLQIVKGVFQPLHDALSNGLLTYDAWASLEVGLPRNPLHRLWDKCERLRKGLILTFLEYEWSIGSLIETIPDPHTFKLVLETCMSIRSGKSLLRRIADFSESQQDAIPQGHRAVLTDFFY